jgi:ferredoxin
MELPYPGTVVRNRQPTTRRTTVLVTVDFDRCEGHGLCTLSAPDVFSFDHRGSLQVVDRPGPEHRAAVEESVGTCPALAIRIETAHAGADAALQ